MTVTSINLEAQYHYWYDKAIEYVFEFFEDPSYAGSAQQRFLSRLLLDPKTVLILLAYSTFQGKRLLQLASCFITKSMNTNVVEKMLLLFTNVRNQAMPGVTYVNPQENDTELEAMLTSSFRSDIKLKEYLKASIHYLMSGWAFFRIFRQLLSNKLGNYFKQWKKSISPYFLNGFRYYLGLLNPQANTVFSESLFC
jgi:hypothetical protein